jgi:serine/threonine-protein kinase RIM15
MDIRSRPQSVIGLNISQLLVFKDKNVFKVATEEMLADDSKTVELVFHIANDCDRKKPLKMEGKGMLMYNRVTGDPSHTMWVIKSLEARRWSIIDNSSLFASAAELVLKQQDSDATDDKNSLVPSKSNLLFSDSKDIATKKSLMPIAMRRAVSQGGVPISQGLEATTELLNLPPALCNICERWVVAVFFEQHSELCAEIHRAEMDVVTCNDSLTELKQYIQGLCDLTKSEVQELESNPDLHLHHTVDTIIENDQEDDNSSIISEPDSIFGESLPIDEDKVSPMEKKRAELDKYMSLLDIMNVALSLRIPGSIGDVNDSQSDDEDAGLQDDGNRCHSLRLKQSSLSKSKIIQILYWRAPQSDDADTESLIHDIEMITKSKIDSVNRMQDCLEYNERTRKNFQLQVIKNSGWTEFVTDASENQEDQDQFFDSTDKEQVSIINESHIEKDTDSKLEFGHCATTSASQKAAFSATSQLIEEKGSQNIKKSIFKKIKDFKLKGRRCSNKQSKRNGKRKSICFGRFLSPVSTESANPPPLPPGSSAKIKTSTPKILEMEVIETPMASPRFQASANINVPPLRRSSLTNQQQQRIQQQSSGTSTPSLGKSPLSPLSAPITSTRPVAPSIKDFDIIKPISKGAFGSVFLAKKRVTGDYYAIKFLKKSDMIAKNQVTNVKAERMILMTQTDSPFVTKLYYTFQSKDYLYLVMEYLNGGDCSSLIKVLGNLSCDWARNYLAEVTLGLSYLHEKNIIHR